MENVPLVRLLPFLLLASIPLGRSLAQDCAPQALPANTAPNAFSKQQEMQLGNHLAQQVVRNLAVSSDTEVTGYVSRIGERLLSRVPGVDLDIRFFVVDSPVPNAFTFAGGRIYLTKGLARFVRNEDELAGILAHELGHALTHQSASTLTVLLKEILGVTSVANENDIVVDLNRLEESWRRDPHVLRVVMHNHNDDEEVADRVALSLLVNAGYSTQGFVDASGRITQTTGKPGNWLTDLFGLTSPDARRMRELLKQIDALPRTCLPQAPPSVGDFQRWRSVLLDFSAWDRRRENLGNVLSEIKLDPIVLRQLTDVRFSPDGKYLLAREADRIHVFTREPFAFAFGMDAPHTVDARFTADSRSIAFAAMGGRVEIWDIAARRLTQSFDPLEKACVDAIVSPDAKNLACLGGEWALTVVELSSNTNLFERRIDRSAYRFASRPFVDFSPDGRYFVVSADQEVIVIDLLNRKRTNLPGVLEEHMRFGFAFTAPDRIVTFPGMWSSGPRFTTFTFPAGKVLDNLIAIPQALFSRISATSNGGFVLLRPFDKYGVVAIDLREKKLRFGERRSPLDFYGDAYVRPLDDGGLGLFDLNTLRLRSRVDLPATKTGDGRFQKTFISPDLRWVAGCGSERCGLWNAQTGKQLLLLRPLNTGWFGTSGTFYADFPKDEKIGRTLARIDPETANIIPAQPIDDSKAWMCGQFLISLRSTNNREVTYDLGDDIVPLITGSIGRIFAPCGLRLTDTSAMACDVTLDIRDATNGRMLWSRHFSREGPVLHVEPDEDRVLLKWPVSAGAAKEEIKGSEELSERLAAAGPKAKLDLLEIVSATEGQVQKKLLIDSGLPVSTVGDRMIVSHRDYFEIYSLVDGHKEGEIFGSLRAYSKSAELVAVNGSGDSDLSVYDLRTRQSIESLAFRESIAAARFSENRQLLVLTNGQIEYTFKIPADSDAAAEQAPH